MANYDRNGAKLFTWNFTTDGSGNASTTTDPINGVVQRVSLVEGTVSAADWAFTAKDVDAFTFYSNASVTGNVTAIPSKVGDQGGGTAKSDFLWALNSGAVLNVTNGSATGRTGTVRIYYV